MELEISAADQERINELVQNFRHRIENLYRMGYLQGRIESEEKARDALKATLEKLPA